jgi:hypothetical protein
MVDFTDSPQFIPHTQKSLTYSPHDVKWVPSSARLVSVGATASAKGILEVYALSGGELKKTTQAGKETEESLVIVMDMKRVSGV